MDVSTPVPVRSGLLLPVSLRMFYLFYFSAWEIYKFLYKESLLVQEGKKRKENVAYEQCKFFFPVFYAFFFLLHYLGCQHFY